MGGRPVTRDEVRAALDSRLPLPYEVTVDGPDGLVVAFKHHWSIHPWFLPVNARLRVQIGRDGDNNLYLERARIKVSEGVYRKARRVRWGLRSRVFRLLRTGTPELRADPQRNLKDETNLELLVSLIGVYAGQFGSYTTLLWQVPVLGLTAQAFLLTIALESASSRWARCTASVLSIIIALASAVLMHNQHGGYAINHGEILRRLSGRLPSDLLVGAIELDDALPQKTNGQNVWAVDHFIYHAWIWCMYLFVAADVTVIISTALNLSWFK